MNENKEKTAGNLANSVVEGYDYSVAVRMSGRAGAYSPTGGKGNAFEVMYSDKKNLSNLLKLDTTTTLTNSSTARQVDLVTKKGNRIIERIHHRMQMRRSIILQIIFQITFLIIRSVIRI